MAERSWDDAVEILTWKPGDWWRLADAETGELTDQYLIVCPFEIFPGVPHRHTVQEGFDFVCYDKTFSFANGEITIDASTL